MLSALEQIETLGVSKSINTTYMYEDQIIINIAVMVSDNALK